MLFWDIIERHFDEAEFLWGLWEDSLVAPGYTLDEVAQGPEERLLAHIDGLVANGPEVARRLLNPALERGEPQRVSAAALALLQSPGESGVEAVLVALRTLPKQRGPLARALACADRPDLLERVRGLLRAPEQGAATAAAEVLLFHHAPLGVALPAFLESEDPAAQALGLRALPGEPASTKHVEHMARLQAALAHKDPHVAAIAMEAGCRLGLDLAWQRVREQAASTDKAAMLLLALGGGPADHGELIAALADAARRPAALWALGFVGTPEAVDASLEWLKDDQVSHLAGEVFTAVTGINLAEAGFKIAPEEAEVLGYTAEDGLPRPDTAKLRRWWAEHRREFNAGQRYLMGRPRSLSGLLAALSHGPMRRRPALQLELQLRAPPHLRPLLQTAAPTRRQYAEVAALRALEKTAIDISRPLL